MDFTTRPRQLAVRKYQAAPRAIACPRCGTPIHMVHSLGGHLSAMCPAKTRIVEGRRERCDQRFYVVVEGPQSAYTVPITREQYEWVAGFADREGRSVTPPDVLSHVGVPGEAA